MKNDLSFPPSLRKILHGLRHIKRAKISFQKIYLQHTNEKEWGVNHCLVKTKIQQWVAGVWKWLISLLQDLFFASLRCVRDWQTAESCFKEPCRAVRSGCSKAPTLSLVCCKRLQDPVCYGFVAKCFREPYACRRLLALYKSWVSTACLIQCLSTWWHIKMHEYLSVPLRTVSRVIVKLCVYGSLESWII